jgi:hypothetical protein
LREFERICGGDAQNTRIAGTKKERRLRSPPSCLPLISRRPVVFIENVESGGFSRKYLKPRRHAKISGKTGKRAK